MALQTQKFAFYTKDASFDASDRVTAKSNNTIVFLKESGIVWTNDTSFGGNDTIYAIKNHASSGTAYGLGTDSLYGHVKLSNAINSSSSTDGGVAATPYAVKQAYDLANGKWTWNESSIKAVKVTNAGYADHAGYVDNSLSWSGYTSGSYNGSAAASISLQDTSYGFAGGTNGFTVTPYVNGTAQSQKTISVTPSFTVTDNSANAFGWNTTYKVGSVNGKDIYIKTPENPDTNTTYTLSGTDTSIVTLTPSSGNATTARVNNVAYATSAGSASSATSASYATYLGTSSSNYSKSTLDSCLSGKAWSSHTHGNITNAGAIGSTADYTVVTTTSGKLTAVSHAVSDPTSSANTSGASWTYISGVSQSSNGKITPIKKTHTISIADLGLTNALVFKGVTTTAISEGSTTNPIVIGDASVTVVGGNIVLYGDKEFVWVPAGQGVETAHWAEMGDQGSYALKTITISAGDGLTGGGNLTDNRTISLANHEGTSGDSGWYDCSVLNGVIKYYNKDTNTTYSAGNGLTLSGTTFSLSNQTGTASTGWQDASILNGKVKYYNSNTTYSAGSGLSLSSTTFSLASQTGSASTGWADASVSGGKIQYYNTNTTYSAGSGITLTGTTFSLSAQTGSSGTGWKDASISGGKVQYYNTNYYLTPVTTVGTTGLKIGTGTGGAADLYVQNASTSVYGVTKLYDGVDSTSTSLAATANAAKTAYTAGTAAQSALTNHINNQFTPLANSLAWYIA